MANMEVVFNVRLLKEQSSNGSKGGPDKEVRTRLKSQGGREGLKNGTGFQEDRRKFWRGLEPN